MSLTFISHPPAAPWSILLFAALIRASVARFSIGSNDALIWYSFGSTAWRGGFYELWVSDPLMNHPPLTVMWAALAYGLTDGTRYAFSLVMKLPGLAGDVASTWLVWRIVADRSGDERRGRVAALLFALAPASVLVTGFHCNVDALLATFLLLSWWLADRGHYGWAGAALGAAINVKLVAAPTVFLLLACAATPRQAARATVALAVAAVPFAWMTWRVGTPFLAHTLGYRPDVRSWLFDLPWRAFQPNTPPAPWLYMQDVHRLTALPATLLLLMVLVLARVRSRGRRDLLAVGALFWSAFLVWNGGAYQYAVWPLPLLAAIRPRLAFAYAAAAGVWLAWAYAEAWRGGFPVMSLFPAPWPPWSPLASALPVACLIVAVVDLRRDAFAPRVDRDR